MMLPGEADGMEELVMLCRPHSTFPSDEGEEWYKRLAAEAEADWRADEGGDLDDRYHYRPDRA